MRIHKDFLGGNIEVVSVDGNNITLKNEIRDTTEDWFYWAFCVEGAKGKTITFNFEANRLGWFGPAISTNLVDWDWLDSVEGDSFTHTLDSDKVYFAHSFLYHPARFETFAKANNLKIDTLCKSRKGRNVPCITFGEGKRHIILTARHHACESTGSYVLEGVLSQLIKTPIEDTTIFCGPFVDFDGVVDGDQGKARAPYDHNRDYGKDAPAIYPESRAIREYADKNGCFFGFDFHSPWHRGAENDCVFIVQNSLEKIDRLNRFGEIFESNITEGSLKYYHKNDYPFGVGWNKGGPQFARYMSEKKDNQIAFTLETAYFGTPDNKVSGENMVEMGRCFAKSVIEYVKKDFR